MNLPVHLLDQSIEQLETLSAFLAGDIPSNSRSCVSMPFGVRLSKETLLTISVLLPKRRTMRAYEALRTPTAARQDSRGSTAP